MTPHETYATRFGLRPVAMGRTGMVATANPLATQAGVRMLARGGNAVDAVVAAAAAIGVVEEALTVSELRMLRRQPGAAAERADLEHRLARLLAKRQRSGTVAIVAGEGRRGGAVPPRRADG